MSDGLSKEQYFQLILDSLFLSSKLVKSMRHQRWLEEHGKGNLKMSARIDKICHRSWCRHWRRITYFAKTFGEDMYIPDWYIAEKE